MTYLFCSIYQLAFSGIDIYLLSTLEADAIMQVISINVHGYKI